MNKTEIFNIAKTHLGKPNANPGQLEAIVDAVEAILNGTKNVIISAPTGSGKSIIATTIHRTLREIKGRWRTTLITSTKSLQDQYTDDDRAIVDLRGKTNYSCPYGVGPYNSGGCRSTIASGKCTKAIACPYVRKRTQWCNMAELRITNSSFQIEACPKICMEDENKADLIVVDECHEIDDLIIEHTSIELNVEDYVLTRQYGGAEFLSALSGYIEIFKRIEVGATFSISDSMYQGMDALNGLVADLVERLEELLSEKRNDKELIGTLIENLQQIQDKTQIFDACGQDGTWILHSYSTGKVEIKPVFAWQVAEHSLLRKAPFFVFMSATVGPIDFFMKSIGISEINTHVIVIDNPIPVKNRMIDVVPVMKVSGNYDIDKLVNSIDLYIKSNQGKNGIIHTVSYDLANKIKERSKYRNKILVSGDMSDIMTHLRQGTGYIVASPSITKGYDFKNDLSRFQIIAKIPFLFLGDSLVALNAKERPEWYAAKTINILVQSCGRSIRGVDDWAKTIILDSNFLRLLSSNVDAFPEWFLESLQVH